MNELRQYLDQSDYRATPGRSTPLADFAVDLHQWLYTIGADAADWPPARIRARLAAEFPIGLGAGNRITIGNLAKPTKTYELADGKLRLTKKQTTA